MSRILKWSGLGVLGLVALIGIALVAGRYWLASDSGLFWRSRRPAPASSLRGLAAIRLGD
ncbi:MAG: hypothetical protein ACKVH0_02220 [Alphaproteobacteria bacterium]